MTSIVGIGLFGGCAFFFGEEEHIIVHDPPIHLISVKDMQLKNVSSDNTSDWSDYALSANIHDEYVRKVMNVWIEVQILLRNNYGEDFEEPHALTVYYRSAGMGPMYGSHEVTTPDGLEAHEEYQWSMQIEVSGDNTSTIELLIDSNDKEMSDFLSYDISVTQTRISERRNEFGLFDDDTSYKYKKKHKWGKGKR